MRESAKHRRLRKLYVIEGFADLDCIRMYQRDISEVYYCRSLVEKSGLLNELELLMDGEIPFIELAKEPFLKASYRKNPDGFLTVAHQWALSLNQFDTENKDVCVVLDGVEKPGNLGAILRIMEAMGVETLFLSDACVDYFNPNVVRSSRGLLAGIKVGKGTKEEVFSLLKKQGYFLVGTSGECIQSIWDYRFENKTALIFGSEKNGLSAFWKNRLHTCLKIPMQGRADSLNLHSSVACFLAEYNRQSLL